VTCSRKLSGCKARQSESRDSPMESRVTPSFCGTRIVIRKPQKHAVSCSCYNYSLTHTKTVELLTVAVGNRNKRCGSVQNAEILLY